MRRHSLLGRFAPVVEPGRFARVVSEQHLAAARIQPSYYPWGEAWVDLVFVRGGEVALVPFVQIDPAMILVRESSPMLWPSWLPLEEPVVNALEERLEPWLLSHALLGALDAEVIGFFTEDREALELFERAREARFLCAAPAEAVLADAAPYVYAQRFVATRRVGIASPECALGASLLSVTASSVLADTMNAERNALAQRWYGVNIYGELQRAAFDVAIGSVDRAGTIATISLDPASETGTPIALAQPVFPMLACSFDPADAEPIRRFRASGAEPVLRANRIAAAPIIGGSEGRIGIIVRDDGLIAPEADVDQAQALAAALRDQGFDARVTPATAARAENFDLIHLIGHRHVHQFSYVLEQAKLRNVPVVVTALLDDFNREAMWGTGAIRSMVAGIADDATHQMIERGIAERRVIVDEQAQRGNPSFDEGAVREMFAQARAAIFASAAEEAHARERYGFNGSSRIVPAVPAAPVAPEPIGALTGTDEYVLVHAAVEPRANQGIAVRAAAAIGVPLVLCGTVEHAEYYQRVLETAGSSTIWLPSESLTPGQLEALYAGARVFADLSWAGHGAYRLVYAAAHGSMPVASTALPLAELWPELTGGADPASLESVVTVLRQAWMRAPAAGVQIAQRTSERCDPLRSLQTVLGAYSEAAAVPAS